jgi:hypothetical protein
MRSIVLTRRAGGAFSAAQMDRAAAWLRETIAPLGLEVAVFDLPAGGEIETEAPSDRGVWIDGVPLEDWPVRIHGGCGHLGEADAAVEPDDPVAEVVRAGVIRAAHLLGGGTDQPGGKCCGGCAP